MSDLTTSLNDEDAALTALASRIDAGVASLNDLLTKALATGTSDQATIDQLKADAATAIADIQAETAKIVTMAPAAAPTPAPVPPVVAAPLGAAVISDGTIHTT